MPTKIRVAVIETGQRGPAHPHSSVSRERTRRDASSHIGGTEDV